MNINDPKTAKAISDANKLLVDLKRSNNRFLNRTQKIEEDVQETVHALNKSWKVAEKKLHAIDRDVAEKTDLAILTYASGETE